MSVNMLHVKTCGDLIWSNRKLINFCCVEEIGDKLWNHYKELENIFKKKVKISDTFNIKNTVTETKNLIECFNSILETRDKNHWIRSI